MLILDKTGKDNLSSIVNTQDNNGHTPLLFACLNENWLLAKKLLNIAQQKL
jgi:hypothetical protein